MQQTLKRALISTLPVLTGYLVLGFGFGIVLRAEGGSVLLAAAMSVLIYAGSMQYVAISLLTGGASLISIAITTLMVNARHIFYGISMLDRYRNIGAAKSYLIFALTDETYSLVCSDALPVAPEQRKAYYVFVSLFNHLYWVAGTLLGAWIGTLISFDSRGIDFALTALFVTVFVEQWLSTKDHGPAIVGVAATVLCLLSFGKDVFLIPSMAAIAAILILMRRRESHA